jgi:hypothetical protein
MKQSEKERIASIIISEKLRNRSVLLPSLRLEMGGRVVRRGDQARFNYPCDYKELRGKKKVDR